MEIKTSQSCLENIKKYRASRKSTITVDETQKRFLLYQNTYSDNQNKCVL